MASLSCGGLVPCLRVAVGQRGCLRIFFIILVGAVGGGILVWLVWLLFGRAFATAVDRHFLSTSIVGAADSFAINESDFIIGARRWPLPRNGSVTLKITVDPRQRLLFSADGKEFTLGTISKVWAEPREAQYQFSPEAGDVVAFTRASSRFAWPTPPLRITIMGGKRPSWRRHVYDRLTWTKISGAMLEVVWCDEQCFYPGTGWTDTNTNHLVTVTVRGRP